MTEETENRGSNGRKTGKPPELTAEQETDAEIQAKGEYMMKFTGEQKTMTEIERKPGKTCLINKRKRKQRLK